MGQKRLLTEHRGLLLLHKSHHYWVLDEYGSESLESAKSLASLRSIITICGDIADSFNTRVDSISPNVYSLPGSNAGYEAAITYMEFSCDSFGTTKYNETIDKFLLSMDLVGERWTIGRELLQRTIKTECCWKRGADKFIGRHVREIQVMMNRIKAQSLSPHPLEYKSLICQA